MSPELERALASIAWGDGYTLAELRSRSRIREICDARRKCYRFLRRRGWSVQRIGEYFLRSDRAVWQALQGEAVSERKREYLRGYHERRRAA